MKALAIVALLSTIAQAFPIASDSHKASRTSEASINVSLERTLLADVLKGVQLATANGVYATNVSYGDTPYLLVFDVTRKLSDLGYIVTINRASRLISVSW